jgi:SagB-type dehydrogenase family enzyme
MTSLIDRLDHVRTADPDSTPQNTLRQMIGLRPGVRIVPVGEGIEIHHPWGRHTLRGLSEHDLVVLHRLTGEPLDGRELTDERLQQALRSLANLVTVTIAAPDGNPLVVATPINRRAGLIDLPVGRVGNAHLSRFAYLRRLSENVPPVGGDIRLTDGMSLESPLSNHRLCFPNPAVAAFVSALAGRADLTEVADQVGLDRRVGELVVSVLAGSGMLESDQDEQLALWEFHDLLFHTRSRYGLHDYEAGGVYSHPDIPHAEPLPERTGAVEVDLERPEWQDVVSRDGRLTEVLENRRSLRQYATQPITRSELSEFLYRTARARRLVQAGGEHPYIGVDRPYPLGGGMGELELYLVVHECEGLKSGIYWYDSAAHRLVLRSSTVQVRRQLAAQAWLATGGSVDRPQIQFCITSRLSRVQWKYSAIAYSVTLKHVGVLLQTLYLVATAMGLSPCANGSGDTELVARAIQVDWAAEPPVGEFLLGGRPVEQPAQVSEFADLVEQRRASSRG